MCSYVVAFMNQHQGEYIIFGDFNTVRRKVWVSLFPFSNHLVDVQIGGRQYKRVDRQCMEITKIGPKND